MPIIDTHAHLTPERFEEAIRTTGSWHGLTATAGRLQMQGFAKSLQQRLEDMDADGIDVQLISPTIGFYQYDNELETTIVIARECNDAVRDLVVLHPARFAGLGTLPMQDVPSAIAELERCMGELQFKGVMIDDHVNGRMYDEPDFLPFFKRCEELGALVFFHQGGSVCVRSRINRYALPNAVGNLTDRTLTFAALVFGGVMDACPNLKVLLGHAGGYVAYGIGRLDKVAGAFEGEYAKTGKLTPPFGRTPDSFVLTRPPSTYVSQFYYDCCIYDGAALRYLIDTVGIDKVMLGTDYPAPMLLIDSVRWVRSLDVLTSDEKEAILAGNATALLGL